MRRRDFIGIVGAAAAWPLAAHAAADRARLIGVLMNATEDDPAGHAWLAALRDGLAKFGWTQGNIRVEVRWGSDATLIERYAAELVALNADVLVGESTAALRALHRATKTIPIVFLGVADPVGQGLVASLAHPGGNITGFSVFDAPMAGKWLEMLTQLTPPVARAAVLYNPATTPYAGLMLRACEEAARPIALAIRTAPANDESGIESVMAGIAREEHSGVIVLPGAFTVAHHEAIVAVAARQHIPAVYGVALFTRSGGLMAYGPDMTDHFRRAADYVDRILKGDKPADLPVQDPTKFDLSINLKAAKALGVTFAPTLLATADEVIE